MGDSLPLVSVVRFGYRYHRDDSWVLHDLDMSLDQEDLLVLTGASGSGKSTFASALNGTVPHFHGGQMAGTLQVCGLDPAEVPMSTTFRRVGVLFQDPAAQIFGTSAEHELAFGLESLGLPRREIYARISRVVATLEIANLLHRAPHTLSGGEQQLILLAAFLALAPQLLVLDEPMTMLDARARKRVLAALREIHMHTTGLVVVDHQLDDYGDVASHFALMEDGTIPCQGSPSEVVTTLLRRPGAGVAAPTAAYWWCERILPALRRYGNHSLAIPLTIQAAQQYIEHLPTEVLDDLRPVIGQYSDTEAPSSRKHSRAGQTSRVEWMHVTHSYTHARRESWYGKKPVTLSLAESALQNVSSALEPGEIVALLGPNGAGKSTLLQTLNGLVRPQQGEVRICGVPIGRRPIAELARIVGYAPQRPERLFFCSTVAEELAVGPRALGVDTSTKEWQSLLIETLNLGPLLQRSPYTLSIGQQRRVGLAAVLASHPQIVALDEPTAGLDVTARATLVPLLRRLAADGATILVVTHDIEFAASVASRWLAMVAGRLVADDTPTQIMMNTSLLNEAALEPGPSYQLNHWLYQRLAREDAARS